MPIFCSFSLISSLCLHKWLGSRSRTYEPISRYSCYKTGIISVVFVAATRIPASRFFQPHNQSHRVLASLRPHPLLMHAAALLSVAAMAFRNQLKLRAILLLSIPCNTVYALAKNPGPAWPDVFWNVVTFAITLNVLAQIVPGRTHIGLTADVETRFSPLSVPDARRISPVDGVRSLAKGGRKSYLDDRRHAA